jgi:recombinational DNA repair protein RecT
MNTISKNGPGAAGNAKCRMIAKAVYGGGCFYGIKQFLDLREQALDLREQALEQNPKLAECTEKTFTGALLQVISLRLNLDHVTLVPRKNEEGELECIFRLGHRGYLELLHRVEGAAA